MYKRNNQCSSLIRHSHIETATEGKKPLMIKGPEWKNIKKHVSPFSEKPDPKELEDEKRYDEYLKHESRAMTRNWDNTVDKKLQRKNAEKERVKRDKVLYGERLYNETKQSDENNRKELLKYAEDMMQCLKPGPQQLERAFALSEAIEQQRLQREQRCEAFNRDRMNYLNDGVKQMQQAQQWIQDQVEQVQDRTVRCREYKKLLSDDIVERDKRRQELKQRLIEEEKLEFDSQQQKQNELMAKERLAMQQKKAQLRKNSFDSFRSIRQKQMRDTEFQQLQQKKINQYHQNKTEKEAMDKLNERQRKYRRARAIEELAQKVAQSLPDIEGAEEKCYQNAIKQFASQWEEQEAKRRGHTDRMKQQRVFHHVAEREETEEKKQHQIEKGEVEKINRLKNEQMDCQFEYQKRTDRLNTSRKLFAKLKDQVEERKLKEKMEITDESKYFREENRKDDEHFMKYAQKFIGYAKLKGRVLEPIIRVVNEYNEEHSLLLPKRELPHLKSQVDIGVAEKHFIYRN